MSVFVVFLVRIQSECGKKNRLEKSEYGHFLNSTILWMNFISFKDFTHSVHVSREYGKTQRKNLHLFIFALLSYSSYWKGIPLHLMKLHLTSLFNGMLHIFFHILLIQSRDAVRLV